MPVRFCFPKSVFTNLYREELIDTETPNRFQSSSLALPHGCTKAVENTSTGTAMTLGHKDIKSLLARP